MKKIKVLNNKNATTSDVKFVHTFCIYAIICYKMCFC